MGEHGDQVHRLSRQDARRIAVRAQLLDAPRPTDLLELVRHLTFLQLDPINAVAPSADLVAWSRLGSSYDTEELADALDTQQLVVHLGLARPAEDLALYRAEMAVWPGAGELSEWQENLRDWVDANDGCRRDLLERLRQDGPLPLSELPDTCEVPWRSSGWNNDKNVVMLLQQMVQRGEVATAGARRGKNSRYDLAERIYPDDPVPDLDAALRIRNERRLRSLGLARARSAVVPTEPNDVGAVGEPAVVEGVKGEWRVEPALLAGLEDFAGRAALLSPFDRLVADRRRASEIFDFDYQLEMYKPVAKRRWGYYALPILYGDRLVGKLDATADRAAGVLRVDAIHEDTPFTRRMTSEIDSEIDDLATWLALDLARPDRRDGPG